MFDCQSITFSTELSQERVARARRILGMDVIQRIIGFSLYLLGVTRNVISEVTQMPPGSVRSVLRVLLRDGLSALEDRRQRTSSFLPPPEPIPPKISLRQEEQRLIIDFGIPGRMLSIPAKNTLQLRTILLSMLNNGLLSRKEVATPLGFTAVHTWNLAQKLDHGDVLALVDQRQGQQQDYRVSAEVKAELIQQFVVDLVTEGRTSGTRLSEHLEQRCNVVLPDRTIRYHVKKLGLSSIRHSLPQLLETIKKTRTTDRRAD